MKIAFLADARSPIAINWVRWFVEQQHEVHWISSRVAESPLSGLCSFHIIPLFPELPAGVRISRRRWFIHPAATLLRHWWIPFQIDAHARALRKLLDIIRPELLHAMRIPQEGMTAVRARKMPGAIEMPPVVVSVWGDDFTYHARSSPLMARLTRETVAGVNALHADCRRDIRLASDWGLRIGTKTLVTAGNGGIRSKDFHPGKAGNVLINRFNLPKKAFFILNPRGLRGVARTDTFFKSIPLVLQKVPEAHFLALKMAGSDEANSWVRKLGINQNVTLLPPLDMREMPGLFRLAPVTLSLTVHDGVPNVLLEAIASGSFPICGDLESIREWIEGGKNGLLVPPGDVQAVADAIIRACADTNLREEAARWNKRIIADRAEWNSVMPQVESFYRSLLDE